MQFCILPRTAPIHATVSCIFLFRLAVHSYYIIVLQFSITTYNVLSTIIVLVYYELNILSPRHSLLAARRRRHGRRFFCPSILDALPPCPRLQSSQLRSSCIKSSSLLGTRTYGDTRVYYPSCPAVIVKSVLVRYQSFW